MNKEKLFLYFFAAAFSLLLILGLYLLSPFFTGLFGAIILSLIFWPLHRLSLHFIGRGNPNWAAGVSTTLLFVTIVVPLSLAGWFLFQELHQMAPVLARLANALEKWRQGEQFSQSPWFALIESKLHTAVKLSGIDLERVVIEAANGVTETVYKIGRASPRIALDVFLNVVVLVTTLFFLFRDGPPILQKLKDLIPMDEKHKEHIVSQLYLTMTAIVRGVLVVALVQGAIAGIGFLAARTPSPIFLGIATSICALIPLVGAWIVWFSVFLYYLANGVVFKAVVVLCFGIVVSTVDNFLRPVLIGSETNLPFLVLFLGLVGGVKVYGPMGLFFGPLIVALILAFIKIYREEYSYRIKREGKG